MIKLKSLFRRGQSGPSSNSKYGANQQNPNAVAPLAAPDPQSQNLKGSSSISNLDGIGLSKADKKKQKEFGSRDNLDKKEAKGSKERLVDIRPGKDKSKKESKKQPQPQPQQMSIVQQQQQLASSQHVSGVANSGLIEQQMGGYAIVDQHQLTKELTEINFDGPREDAKLIALQELRQQLDRVSREKVVVEAKLAEMSMLQTEVVALRNEISNMQVRKFINILHFNII